MRGRRHGLPRITQIDHRTTTSTTAPPVSLHCLHLPLPAAGQTRPCAIASARTHGSRKLRSLRESISPAIRMARSISIRCRRKRPSQGPGFAATCFPRLETQPPRGRRQAWTAYLQAVEIHEDSRFCRMPILIVRRRYGGDRATGRGFQAHLTRRTPSCPSPASNARRQGARAVRKTPAP